MEALTYTKAKKILLKNIPAYSEAWLQDRIIEDPTILGLGDLEIRDVERRHPKAGRLDLLLRNPETDERYEIEIMLGTVDESHIIRTIEYWDIERKRYPHYEHIAVIVAENITGRFLNVINLFNGAIPIIAIQLNALQVEDKIVLTFTKVLDQVILGKEDETETGVMQTVDRSYWENKASKDSVHLVDLCLIILREIDERINIKYSRFYISLTENGRANNYIVFVPKKDFMRVEVLLTDKDLWRTRLEEEAFVVVEQSKDHRWLKFRATMRELTEKRDLIKSIFQASYLEQHR